MLISVTIQEGNRDMKKWIAVLLALCMVVTMTPAIAFGAQGTQGADQGQAAVQETQDDQSVDQQELDATGQGLKKETDSQVDQSSGDGSDLEQNIDQQQDTVVQSDEETVGNEGEATKEDPETSVMEDPPQDGWFWDGARWLFYKGGQYLTDWQNLDKGIYFFNAQGHMLTGKQYVASKGKTYFFETSGSNPNNDSLGVLRTGWRTIGSGKYYFVPPDGAMATGLRTIGNARYYFNASGVMQTGWQTISGNRYYFNPSNGAAVRGWFTYGKYKYFFNTANYAMWKGWLNINGNMYYMNPSSGVMTVGWQTIGGKRYYFNKYGKMQHSGWTKINKKTYYFDKKTGNMVKGWLKLGKKKYYLNPKTGVLMKGWIKVGKNKYYMSPKNGVMKKGWLKLKGKKYYLNKKTGAMYVGLKKIKDDRYFFSKTTGAMQTGTIWVTSSKLYYFRSNGKAIKQKGWFTGSDGYKRYCLTKTGRIAYGKMKIGSIWYIFSSKNGRLQKTLGDDIDIAVSGESSYTSYLIAVKKSSHTVRIYRGSKGNWKKSRSFSCSTGSSTPKGRFTVGSKDEFMDTSETCRVWYVTTFSGRLKFHSVLYAKDEQPLKVIDGRLGVTITDGCLRLSLDNAKWIYTNVPASTKVLIL